MAKTSWFDETTEVPLIEEKARNLESFTQAMADGVVEQKELDAQQDRLVEAMRAAEAGLSDEQHEQVTRVLVELSAYNVMRLLRELQVERARIAFS